MKHTINDREGWLKLLNWMTNDYPVLTSQNGFYEISFEVHDILSRPLYEQIDVKIYTDTYELKHPAFWDGGLTFRYRFNPAEIGNYKVQVFRNGSEYTPRNIDYPQFRIENILPQNYVKLHDNHRWLAVNGERFFPVNLNWKPKWNNNLHIPHTVASYRSYCENMARTGFNTLRIYEQQENRSFTHVAIPEDARYEPAALPVGEIDLGNINFIEGIFFAAQENGIYINFAMDERGGNSLYPSLWNIPSYADKYPQAWAASTWNVENGGPLNHPREIHTNTEAKRFFYARNRYVMARWGCMPTLAYVSMANEMYLWSAVLEASTRPYFEQWIRDMMLHWRALDAYGTLINAGNGKDISFDEQDVYIPHMYPVITPDWNTTAGQPTIRGVLNHYNHSMNINMPGYEIGVRAISKPVFKEESGSGTFWEKRLEGGRDNPQYIPLRMEWDRGLVWDDMFSFSAGLTGLWDNEGYFLELSAWDVHVPAIQFAKQSGIASKEFNPMTVEQVNPRSEILTLGGISEYNAVVYIAHVERAALDVSGYPLESVTFKISAPKGNYEIREWDTSTGAWTAIKNISVKRRGLKYSASFRRDIALMITKIK